MLLSQEIGGERLFTLTPEQVAPPEALVMRTLERDSMPGQVYAIAASNVLIDPQAKLAWVHKKTQISAFDTLSSEETFVIAVVFEEGVVLDSHFDHPRISAAKKVDFEPSTPEGMLDIDLEDYLPVIGWVLLKKDHETLVRTFENRYGISFDGEARDIPPSAGRIIVENTVHAPEARPRKKRATKKGGTGAAPTN